MKQSHDTGGFIKLHRSIQDAAFKRDPERFALWVHMLLQASHRPHRTILGGQTVEVKAGQFVSGIRHLSDATGVSFQRVRSSLEFFEREGMIARDTTRRSGTVFTVFGCAENSDFSNTPSTHQINTPINTPINTQKPSNHEASSETATHQSTHQSTHHQHTDATRIQEYKNTTELRDTNVSLVVNEPKSTGENLASRARKVIDHLNNVSGRKFRGAKSDMTTITARLNEGFTVEDLQLIADYKTSEWSNDPNWSKYLRPETLYAARHTDSYLNEALSDPNCPHTDIIAAYHEALPELAVVIPERWEGERKTSLAARWMESKKHQSMAFWNRFFAKLRDYPEYFGDNDRNWKADLGWIVKRENFTKLLEKFITDSQGPRHA
jgi:uncharacterized phage protein (TIGR02220 family)